MLIKSGSCILHNYEFAEYPSDSDGYESEASLMSETAIKDVKAKIHDQLLKKISSRELTENSEPVEKTVKNENSALNQLPQVPSLSNTSKESDSSSTDGVKNEKVSVKESKESHSSVGNSSKSLNNAAWKNTMIHDLRSVCSMIEEFVFGKVIKKHRTISTIVLYLMAMIFFFMPVCYFIHKLQESNQRVRSLEKEVWNLKQDIGIMRIWRKKAKIYEKEISVLKNELISLQTTVAIDTQKPCNEYTNRLFSFENSWFKGEAYFELGEDSKEIKAKVMNYISSVRESMEGYANKQHEVTSEVEVKRIDFVDPLNSFFEGVKNSVKGSIEVLSINKSGVTTEDGVENFEFI